MEDYSSKYVLLRDVKLTETTLDGDIPNLNNKSLHAFDILYSRTETVLRYSLQEEGCPDAGPNLTQLKK